MWSARESSKGERARQFDRHQRPHRILSGPETGRSPCVPERCESALDVRFRVRTTGQMGSAHPRRDRPRVEGRNRGTPRCCGTGPSRTWWEGNGLEAFLRVLFLESYGLAGLARRPCDACTGVFSEWATIGGRVHRGLAETAGMTWTAGNSYDSPSTETRALGNGSASRTNVAGPDLAHPHLVGAPFIFPCNPLHHKGECDATESQGSAGPCRIGICHIREGGCRGRVDCGASQGC